MAERCASINSVQKLNVPTLPHVRVGKSVTPISVKLVRMMLPVAPELSAKMAYVEQNNVPQRRLALVVSYVKKVAVLLVPKTAPAVRARSVWMVVVVTDVAMIRVVRTVTFVNGIPVCHPFVPILDLVQVVWFARRGDANLARKTPIVGKELFVKKAPAPKVVETTKVARAEPNVTP